MKKIKQLTLVLVLLGSLFFLFGPEIIPENLQFQEILNSATNNDVIIIFNSGGWGNTPLEKAKDFTPIIKEIQETLEGWGYNSLVIPYTRTKDDLLGKVAGTKDFLNSFNSSSENLAEKVDFLTENFPNKKIIMTGLSNGATFAEETMEKVSTKTRNSVYTIAAGVPFWHDNSESENILLLDNNGKDALSKGKLKLLALTLIKTPFKWISSKVNGQNLTFSQAIQVPGHQYFWESSEVGPQIVSFLENKFTPLEKSF